MNLPIVSNPVTRIYFETAIKLGLKVEIINLDAIKIFFNNQSHYFIHARYPLNSSASTGISWDKAITYKILNKNGFFVPKQASFYTKKGFNQALKKISFPIVIKPAFGSCGKEVFVKLKNQSQALKAFNLCKKVHRKVIAEEYFSGTDYRFLVLGSKVIGLLKREPPYIIGNGKMTIDQLINLENKQKQIKYPNAGNRNKITKNLAMTAYLAQKGFNYQSIPQNNQKVILKEINNTSSGELVTALNPASIHPSFLKQAVAVTQVLKLTLVAIEMLIKNPHKPYAKNNAVILETNSAPGIDYFHYPFYGSPQEVAEEIIKYLLNN